MKSLKEILKEEVEYWYEAKEKTNNRLLKRVATSNITKRRTQLHKLNRGIKL